MGDYDSPVEKWLNYAGAVLAFAVAVLLLGSIRAFNAGDHRLGTQLLVGATSLGTVVMGTVAVLSVRGDDLVDGIGFAVLGIGTAAVSGHVWTAGAVPAVTPLTILGAVGIVVGVLVVGWDEGGDSHVLIPILDDR